MTEKEQHIVTSAWRVFVKYGISKATMNDIAREAKLARATLYNTFSNKDEVIRAVIRFSAETSLRAVKDSWAQERDLGQKLDDFFRHGPISWYDAARTFPDSEEFFSGKNTIMCEEMPLIVEQWLELFEQAITPYKTALAKRGLEVPEFAKFLYHSATNAKHDAINREDLIERLTTLRKIAVSTVAA